MARCKTVGIWRKYAGFLTAFLITFSVLLCNGVAAQTSRQTPDFTPPQGLENPALGMGLNGIADWSTQQPFIDIMKTARPWTGHKPGQWGGVEAAELEATGVLDPFGWPKIIPKKVTHLEALILTDQPEAAVSLIGRYRVRFDGEGHVDLSGGAQNIQRKDHEIWFEYAPVNGPVGVVISTTDPRGNGNHIRNITILHEAHIPLFEVGAVFNPKWLHHIKDLRLIRFMDWMFTNGSPIKTWQDRPNPGDYTYGRRGVPVEVMVALANQIAADPWFNMPHQATDDYVREFARIVRDNLDPPLVAHVEYSNELWNFIFPQAKWAQEQAALRWGDSVPEDAWMQFAGTRAGEVAQIWTEVFGDQPPSRLVRIIATHTGWPGLEEVLLRPPLSRAAATNPSDIFDAYAITGYFGYEVGTDVLAPKVLGWINDSLNDATAQAETLDLQGDVLSSYLGASKYALADQKLAAHLREQSLPELFQDMFAYQAKVAADNGLSLIMYEGGSHVAGSGSWVENQELTDFLIHFNYTPEMARLYQTVLNEWHAAGGTVFNAFVDVAQPSKWGSWGAFRHLDDLNPRMAALMRYNFATPPDWDTKRALGSFTHGTTTFGTANSDQLGGTTKADILIGLAGDDILRSSGNGDRLNGGDGQDIAVLPGVAEDYQFYKLGDILVADGPAGKTWMFSIETVRFVP